MPCNVRGIVYNKTLFEENGWKVPKSKTEFIELCHTIDNSGVVERAFQPTLAYPAEVLVVGEYFQMSNMFDNLKYFDWFEKYGKTGEGSSDFFLSTFLDTFDELLDENIIKRSDFVLTPAERSEMMYTRRSAAMTIETQNASAYAKDYGSKDEFSMIPFFSGDEEDQDYVLINPITNVAVNKKVAEKGNEEKLKLVTEFLDFVATKEGQDIFVSDGNIGITLLKNAETKEDGGVMLENLTDLIDEGRLVPPRCIFNAGLDLSRNAIDDVVTGMLQTKRGTKNITKENRAVTYDEAVAYLDNINKQVINNTESTVETVYATATKPFTVLETTEYLAEMYKEKTGADICLYLSNTLGRGNNLAIPEGDLVKKTGGIYPYDFVESIDTSNRAQTVDSEGNRIVTYKMTGEQILKAIEYPADHDNETFFEPFFVAAGLNIEFAPWAEKGSRYLKVTLADGSQLEPDKEYTVASWEKNIAEKYITKKIKNYDESFQDVLASKLKKDGKIQPFTDGRFVLNWEKTSSKN